MNVRAEWGFYLMLWVLSGIFCVWVQTNISPSCSSCIWVTTCGFNGAVIFDWLCMWHIWVAKSLKGVFLCYLCVCEQMVWTIKEKPALKYPVKLVNTNKHPMGFNSAFGNIYSSFWVSNISKAKSLLFHESQMYSFTLLVCFTSS